MGEKIKTAPEGATQERLNQAKNYSTRYPYLAYVSKDGWVHRVPLDGLKLERYSAVRKLLIWALMLLAEFGLQWTIVLDKRCKEKEETE